MTKYIPEEKKEQEVTILRSHLNDWQIWMYFLATYNPIISEHKPNLSTKCRKWIICYKTNKLDLTLVEQKTILFSAMPQLEEVWSNWSKYILRSRSSLSEITI